MREGELSREQGVNPEEAISEINAELQGVVDGIDVTVTFEGSESHKGTSGLGSVTLHVKESEGVSGKQEEVHGYGYTAMITRLREKLAARGFRLGEHNGLSGFETDESTGRNERADSWFLEKAE